MKTKSSRTSTDRRQPFVYDNVEAPATGPHFFPDLQGGSMLWEQDEARRAVRDAAARAARYAHLSIVRGEDAAAEGLLAEALGLLRALRAMTAAEAESTGGDA